MMTFPAPFTTTNLQYTIIAIALASMLYGSYTDIRSRTVKSVLFIPLAISGLIFNYSIYAPWLFIIIGISAFFLSFLEPDTYAYVIFGVILLALSVLSFVLIGIYWGYQLAIISIVFLLGFQEKLFGIGDIKAIIAVIYASPLYSPIVESLLHNSLILDNFPTSFAILTDISVFAVIFVIYAIVMLARRGKAGIPGQPMAIKYDSALESRNPAAFRVMEKNGVKFLLYRIPFIVPIFLGYLLFAIIGSFMFV